MLWTIVLFLVCMGCAAFNAVVLWYKFMNVTEADTELNAFTQMGVWAGGIGLLALFVLFALLCTITGWLAIPWIGFTVYMYYTNREWLRDAN